MIAGLSRANSPGIENGALQRLRASLKGLTSDIKRHLFESQKELLELIKPKTTRENENE